MEQKQRLSEWTEASRAYDSYYVQQFKNPYRSTVKFCDWLESQVDLSGKTAANKTRIVDVGAGMGETLAYMAGRFSSCDFVGLDINRELVERGNVALRDHGIKNASLDFGDLYAPDPRLLGTFDGLVSLQTLSWLPEPQEALKKLCSLESKWMALSSLFYEGPVDCRIEIKDYSQPLPGKPYKEAFYNVYSLPLIKDFLKTQGWSSFRFTPFVIDLDLDPPESRGMGTYTVKTEHGGRLQLSGPLLMSWYFVLAKRD